LLPAVDKSGPARASRAIGSATLAQRAVAEALGTAFLLAAVVGSGIMAERLAGGNIAIALLANSLATGAALVALILAFGDYSGAHLNPAVTLAEVLLGKRPRRELLPYVAAQLMGALAGVMFANLMFGESPVSLAHKARNGLPQLLAELIAVLGLLLVVFFASRRSLGSVAVSVGAYITAAYWFTSSTSFANPAVTIARSLTDTFTGIRPADVPGFLAAQGLGTAAAVSAVRWLTRVSRSPRETSDARGADEVQEGDDEIDRQKLRRSGSVGPDWSGREDEPPTIPS
jgi:glycerol uptake facilitator-like aquaporin